MCIRDRPSTGPVPMEIVMISSSSYAETSKSGVSVSYTHLDVYKRQAQHLQAVQQPLHRLPLRLLLRLPATSTIRKVGEAYNTFYMPEYAGVDPDTGEAMWYKGQEGDEKTKNVNEAGQRIVSWDNYSGSTSTTHAGQ